MLEVVEILEIYLIKVENEQKFIFYFKILFIYALVIFRKKRQTKRENI